MASAVTSQLPPSIPSPPNGRPLFLIGKVVPRIKTALPAGLPPRSRGRVCLDTMWDMGQSWYNEGLCDSGRPLPLDPLWWADGPQRCPPLPLWKFCIYHVR